jgi:hypothetical protein
MRTFGSSIAVAVFALILATSAARATQMRTWVSHSGTGSTCSDQQPCRDFVNTLNQTQAGGEINCLDSGDFTNNMLGFVITQSVTIDCGGQMGALTPPVGLNGIVINGVQIVVKLRNLTINGQVSGTTGILIQNAAAVIIENCVIQNFGGAGILVQTSGALELNVSDTLIANNTTNNNFGGITINTNGSAATKFTFDRVRVEHNHLGGIAVIPASIGPVTGVIRDSVVTGSLNSGIFAQAAGGSEVTVSLDHTQVVGNVVGITSANGAAVILNNSTIQTNNTGLVVSSAAAIFSYGNNAINGNQPGGIGTVPTVIGLH